MSRKKNIYKVKIRIVLEHTILVAGPSQKKVKEYIEEASVNECAKWTGMDKGSRVQSIERASHEDLLGCPQLALDLGGDWK